MSRRRVAVLLILTAVAAGCGGQPAGRKGAAASGSPSASSAASQSGAAGQGGIRGYGTVTRTVPACTTATQAAPALPASDTTMTALPAAPFGVSVSSGGRWAFVSAGSQVAVFRLGASGVPVLLRTVNAGSAMAGNVLSPGDQYLLATNGDGGTVVLSAQAAEDGSAHAVLGQLSAPAGPAAGAIEVTVTPDSRYAFVSLEDADEVAVFSLRRAPTDGFGPADYVGAIPTQLAPVGLAVSPDGRWLYSTSEQERAGTEVGSLSVISVARAETDPAHSVVARVAAGCQPVRVITSASGTIVWVTARASDALLAFSASALRTDPSHALLADLRVGEAPVGLALVRGGSLIVVADSNRFDDPGANAGLAVADVPDALAGRPALLGYLPAGLFPRDMAAAPDGDVLLVANYASEQLEAVKLADLP